MILYNIVAALKADSTLHSYIADRIYPDACNETDVPCIVYTFSPVSDDKIVRMDRLEIRVNALDDSTLYGVDARVRQLLLTLGDTPSVTGILKAYLNGGNTTPFFVGSSILQLNTFYTIISRSEN